MKRGPITCAAVFLFVILVSFPARAENAASTVRLEYEDLGLGFCKIHVFYDGQEYGSYMKTNKIGRASCRERV